ncbi:hypothetical protein GRF29_185g756921 [Pseudopithomyces chartarum]|uniref:Uncharacterized protein n=1 Tax=Pseudopithomyces chartarum TaxID=1892770 RepID=A0AAN6RCE7_9PLEO|nr:hypothetical protein GRF29_185g756921 [Pseudopithomyces chartarum]
MRNVPREILDCILSHLLVYEQPVTERYATITRESKAAILSARLVCRGFLNSIALQNSFTRVLEESPLFGILSRSHHLREVAKSKYASKMSLLTLSVFHHYEDAMKFIHDPQIIQALRDLFLSFPHARNLRITCHTHEYPGLASENTSETTFYSLTKAMLSLPGVSLQSLKLPLHNNEEHIVALDPWKAFSPDIDWSSLKILQFDYSDRVFEVLGGWLEPLSNLEVLEVALPCLRYTHFPRHVDFIASSWPRKNITPKPKLKTFRLMASKNYDFTHDTIPKALKVFPNLQSLGLAYFQLV